MSQPELVDQIRAARIAAPPELRRRVLAIAAESPAEPPRRGRRWRRAALMLAPAVVAAALAGALAVGLATSGKGGRPAAQRLTATPGSAAGGAAGQVLPDRAPVDSAAAPKAGAGGSAGAALPATPGRAQLYEAELTLRIGDLSAATKRALRLTTSLHGYVRSVEYGSGADRGTARLVLRIPVGSVQAAIVRFSALGRILDQHVSIRDVQPQLDRRFRQMQAERDTIAKLQARLESPDLSAADRAALENKLVAARRRLVVLRRAQAAEQRRVSYATVALDLHTAAAAVAPAHERGRIGRALHRSGQILGDEAKVLVYALVAGAPLLLLGAVWAGGIRVRRRRAEERLLASP